MASINQSNNQLINQSDKEANALRRWRRNRGHFFCMSECSTSGRFRLIGAPHLCWRRQHSCGAHLNRSGALVEHRSYKNNGPLGPLGHFRVTQRTGGLWPPPLPPGTPQGTQRDHQGASGGYYWEVIPSSTGLGGAGAPPESVGDRGGARSSPKTLFSGGRSPPEN